MLHKQKNQTLTRIITGIILGFIGTSAYLFFTPLEFSWCITILGLLIIFFEWPSFKCLFLTPIYPIVPIVFLILLNQSPYRGLLPLLIISVFAYDTGAYFIGRRLGKHKLCPSISPGKTWEGVLGGLIISLCATTLYLTCVQIYGFIHDTSFSICITRWIYAFKHIHLTSLMLFLTLFIKFFTHTLAHAALFCTVLVIPATLGDLFESYLKRRVKLKDSGNLLPGHGGFLDRFDGIFGAILVLYPLRVFFSQFLSQLLSRF